MVFQTLMSTSGQSQPGVEGSSALPWSSAILKSLEVVSVPPLIDTGESEITRMRGHRDSDESIH